MRSRLDSLPIFDARETKVCAENYNLVSISLKRLGGPIRIELPRLRSLDFYLEKDAWIIVDRSLNDIPIVAWLEFHELERDGLNQPVHCQRRSYHSHAMIIIDKAFDVLHSVLGKRLSDLNNGLHDVIQMKRPNKRSLVTI